MKRRSGVFFLLLGFALFILFAHRSWYIPETDFVAYYQAGERAIHGVGLYLDEATPFKYLPVTSYFFIPFSLGTFFFGKQLFFLVSFFLGLWVYREVYRRIGALGTVAVLACMLRFHNYDFLNSQINHVLLALFMVFLKYRASRPWIAAFCFSTLASFKVLPLLLIIPIIVGGNWREGLRIFTTLTALLLLPVFTFASGIFIYSEWYELLKRTTEWPAPTGAILQSISGGVWYWFGEFLGNSKFLWLMSLIQLGFLLLLGWLSWARRFKNQETLLVGALAGTIVLSPLAWKHNYLLSLPVFVLLWEMKRYVPFWTGFALMTGVSLLVGPISKYWVDRSYTTVIGLLIIVASLFHSFRTENATR